MGLDIQKYNQQYKQRASNDASKYGLAIEEASVQPGEKYWKIIGVHHLTPEENRSNHHVYIEGLDESGKRVQSAWAGWTWEGRGSGEIANPVILDKPANEAGTNIAINKNQKIAVWMNGRNRDGGDKSDKLVGISTIHPDEPAANGEFQFQLHRFGMRFHRPVRRQRWFRCRVVLEF